MTLPRGFKAEAEREALRVREELNLEPTDGLSPHALAAHLKVAVVDASTLVELEALEEIERLQAFSFSAATFDFSGKKVIVTNPIRTPGRLNSDVAHELAHIMLKHDLSEIRDLAGTQFRTCKPDEEEQATTFGGTLLLPRPLLASAARRGSSIEGIAETYAVTVEMARFRYNTTGVAKQVGQSARFK